MSSAYLVLAHKNLDQLARLSRRLSGERSRVLVHVDAATDVSAHEAELREIAGLTLLARRHRCPWGGFELVQATLDLMAAALAAGGEVERLTLLSGQDYPIKPPERIEAFLLDENPQRTFMEHFRLPRPDWGGGGGLERIEDLHFRLGGRLRSLPISRLGLRRSPPSGLVAHQGGQYWSMTRADAEHVLGYVRSDPRVTRFFRRTAVPDELFFQTIVMSSPLADAVENDDLRYERWDEGQDHPAILTVDDLPALRASPALFAKKFDTTVDAEVLDRIDEERLG